MQKKVITLRSLELENGITLELPGEQPISKLIPEILKVLQWPETFNNKLIAYTLKIDDKELNQALSLDQLGVENFQTIWITSPKQAQTTTTKLREIDIPINIDNSLPFWERITVSEPCLVSSRGLVFNLRKPTTLIGRNDENNSVDIDLSELENYCFISSRKHAEIIRSDQAYILHPYRTTNGTFLNGIELNAGEIYPLTNGDIIQFGSWGVQLAFKRPE
jgi:hypothetical protein